jgi:hypothetical protein
LKRWARTKSLRRENSDAVYKRICDKAFAISPRRNIGIGGYGSRLKAGTTNDFIAASIFKQLSSSSLIGRSSTLRLRDSFSGASGMLDRPVKPGDDDGGCGALAQPSLRAKRSNPSNNTKERWIASSQGLLGRKWGLVGL